MTAPLAKRSAAELHVEPSLLAAPPPDRERFRILIVDDDPINLAVLDSQLRAAGYEVAQEPSGPAALTRLAEQRFDAVVLDVMMPKMSGYGCCAGCAPTSGQRASRPSAHRPHARTGHRRRLPRRRQRLLTKPFRAPSFCRASRRTSRWLRPTSPTAASCRTSSFTCWAKERGLCRYRRSRAPAAAHDPVLRRARLHLAGRKHGCRRGVLDARSFAVARQPDPSASTTASPISSSAMR